MGACSPPALPAPRSLAAVGLAFPPPPAHPAAPGPAAFAGAGMREHHAAARVVFAATLLTPDAAAELVPHEYVYVGRHAGCALTGVICEWPGRSGLGDSVWCCRTIPDPEPAAPAACTVGQQLLRDGEASRSLVSQWAEQRRLGVFTGETVPQSGVYDCSMPGGRYAGG